MEHILLYIYHSNNLEKLISIIEDIMKNEKIDDPLLSEMFLISRSDMAQWLQMSISNRLSISANIKFFLPANFIWNIFISILPMIPKNYAFDKNTLRWKLTTLLPEIINRNEFIMLRDYLDRDKDKLFQLTLKIAKTYSKYIIYRPQWILYWENNKIIYNLPKDQNWQFHLWRAIIQYNLEVGDSIWHYANLYMPFIKALKKIKSTPKGLPPRLFICGISTMPKLYLKILHAIGKFINIYFFLITPYKNYKDINQNNKILTSAVTNEDFCRNTYKKNNFLSTKQIINFNISNQKIITPDSSNLLLESWGKLGREFIYMLSNINNSETLHINAFIDLSSKCLLHNLQKDILEKKDKTIIGTTFQEFSFSYNKRLLNPEDRSVIVHACRSIKHEIEVLYKNLLEILNSDPNLNLRDILVIIPDIDAYFPFIRSVFGNNSKTNPLSYSIYNLHVSQSNSLIQNFINILYILDSRFTSEDVLELLEVSAIASRFNINAEEIQYLRKWIKESGIRWGIDEDNAKQFQISLTGQYTWKFGLTRMLLGYAMDSSKGEWNNIFPYDESRGSIADLAGNLATFLMKLNYWRKFFIKDRTLKELLPICRNIFNDFFVINEDLESSIDLIEEQWKKIIISGIQSQYHDSISLLSIRNEIINHLSHKYVNPSFLSGKINFCTPTLMGSIPFKIICLLGMNDGIFPRNLVKIDFDLMTKKNYLGDYDYRDKDRYIFLETLMSAQEKLYISYTGFSLQGNKKRFPSILVQELIDYIGKNYYLPGDELCNCDESDKNIKSHITVFHDFISYNLINSFKEKKQNFILKVLPSLRKINNYHDFIQKLDSLNINKLSLEELIRFWKHPVKAFFQMRLKINFPTLNKQIPDIEIFNMDNKQRYLLNQNLLNSLIQEDQQKNKLFLQYVASGELPYGSFGKIIWDNQYLEMQDLANIVLKYLKNSITKEISFECSGVQITGWLQNVQADGLLRWRPAIFNILDGIQLWIEHLVYCACGGNGGSRIIFRNKKEWVFSSLHSKQALKYLSQLIYGYKNGMKQPLLLPVKSISSWIETCYDAQTKDIIEDDAILKKAQEKFWQTYEGSLTSPGEGNDIWYKKAWKNLNSSHLKSIIDHAKIYLLPIYKLSKFK